jgi:hypothetical protein
MCSRSLARFQFAVVQVPWVPKVGHGALEVPDKDSVHVCPIVGAINIELLEPSPSRARQKQGEVLDHVKSSFTPLALIVSQ